MTAPAPCQISLGKRVSERGAVLVLSLIFMTVFSALAVGLAAFTNSNAQIAYNHTRVNRARAATESGLEVVRYLLHDISFSGLTLPENRLTSIKDIVEAKTTDLDMTQVTPFLYTHNSTQYMIIPPATLDSSHQSFFFATLHQPDTETIRVYIYGFYDSLMRSLQIDYRFGHRANTVFDFGVATKGPLSIQGNILLDGANVSIESNAYIESWGSILALEIIGNSQIGGNVKIANPIGIVDLQGGQAGIGGETGQDAIDNHVDIGVPFVEFPEPDPSAFISYATAANNIIDSDTDTSSDMVLENITIEPGTNPSFSGQVTLKGVVYVKQPNVVTFNGGVNITGVIVTDGSYEDDSGVNQLIFQGNVDSNPVSDLPQEEQFEGLHAETGTFIIAPGFATSFGGNFSTLSGAIASNGITFFGNAGGTISGSVINYSEATMDISGNTDLFFNRSGLSELPAGFVPQTILECNVATYCEPILQQFAFNN